MSPQRSTGLQLKLVAILLVVGLVPVIVSAILIDRISEVAQNFASNEVARMVPALQRSQVTYRRYVERTKALHLQVAKRIAGDREVAKDPEMIELGLVRARATNDQGEELWVVESGRPSRPGDRHVDVQETLPVGTLQLRFAVDEERSREFQALGQLLDEARQVGKVRRSLPSSYRTAFVAVVGGFAVLLITLGIWLGRGVTRRIDELVAGFRAVAAGDMSVRVDGRGRDELAEMGRAFNRMVADLESERRKSVYLQRIGTWQDVARKLAHEIKNPLTPIQLAVQQVQSSYPGDDERFAKLLGDAGEIVTEEIDNLRRLVDAFRELGRLPKVEPKAIDLQVVIDDLAKDPELAEGLQVNAPDEPISVRADRLLLRRVLHNLIENGIQAGGAPVAISWSRSDDGRVRIVVDDCGEGVDEELVSTLFEPYVTSKESGTGLGLAISKKIAIEHGGSLELDPEGSPRGGARFVVVIPSAD